MASSSRKSGFFYALGAAWLGKARLPVVFYGWVLAGNVLNFMLASVLAWGGTKLASDSAYFVPLFELISNAFLAMILVYYLTSMVMLWRCAHNANNPHWGLFARLFVILHPLLIVTILQQFVEISYPDANSQTTPATISSSEGE